MSADAEVVEEVRAELEPYRPPVLAVAPTVTAADLVQRLDVIREAMARAMERDVDYGVIPGTGTKPTLLKPGAEKLGALFQLDVQLANEKIWHDDGHLTVISRATVYHQPTGARLGGGEGICTTRESKYGWRKAERVCPVCGKAAIIKGKAEYGGGWLCWAKKDGCGAKFADGDKAIEGQNVERVPNPDLPDTYNTVDKMASKRARIDAVLAVTGASALFTQDVEEFQPPTEAPPEATTAPQARTDAPAGTRTAPKRQTASQRVASAEDLASYQADVEAANLDWPAALAALGPEPIAADTLAQHREQLSSYLAKVAAKGTA